MKIKDYMKKKRKILGLSQYKLAKLLHKTNIDICKYESGVNMPAAQTLLNFQEVLKQNGIEV
jgi:transcriptional regulator with XRE-family HTH domain